MLRIRLSTGCYGEDTPWQDFDADTATGFARGVRQIWMRLDGAGRLCHPETGGRHLEIHLWRRDHWVRVPGVRGGQSLISGPLHATESWPLITGMADHADRIDELAGWAAAQVE